jgi:hypothetical protein
MKMKRVLTYQQDRAHQSTVRRHFIEWRQQKNPPIPAERCDNEACWFYTEPLVWNGEPFKPILDHKNGVNSDNRPENLQFLCPNCDSQQKTRGGGNKGRVEKSEGGFALVQDGIRDYVLPAESGSYLLSGEPGQIERTEYENPTSGRKKDPPR